MRAAAPSRAPAGRPDGDAGERAHPCAQKSRSSTTSPSALKRSHHIDSTTILSDKLLKLGVDHEIVGVPESVTAALDAQQAMVAFAARTAGWDLARSLCVPKTSSKSCDQAIFVDEPADASLSSDAALTEIDQLG